MPFYDTNAKFDSSLIDKMGGTGKALGFLGQSLVDTQKDKLEAKKQESTTKYYDAETKMNLDKNTREAEKNTREIENEKRILKEASEDKNKMAELEDGLIKAYETKHPIFMGAKTKDGKEVPEYKNMTRSEKLALIKLAGDEQINPKSANVVNVSTREDGERVAIFKDGTIKPLGFKAKDYQNKSTTKDNSKVTKDAPYGFNEDGTPKTIRQVGEEQTKKRYEEKYGSTATLNID
jgi:vacuolar-type H+-ATPase subunit I/STV1